jgi:hypothetical protein
MTRQKLVKEAVEKLLLESKVITTLDVKTFLRGEYSDYYWTQDFVSEEMNNLLFSKEIINFTFRDNGIYREYYIYSNFPSNATTTANVAQRVSTNKLVDVLRNDLKGQFCTVEYIKLNGDTRTVNGKPTPNFFDNNGYILFVTSKGNVKRILPKNIQSISVRGETFKKKK